MGFKHVSPVITTTRLDETKKFYTSLFGFQIVFEAEWYLHLKSNDGAIELGFMLPHLETQHEAYRPGFSGQGLIYNFEVENPESWFEKAKAHQVQLIEDFRFEPWGEKHFTFFDPNGVVINVTKQIEPDKSFAENYAS